MEYAKYSSSEAKADVTDEGEAVIFLKKGMSNVVEFWHQGTEVVEGVSH